MIKKGKFIFVFLIGLAFLSSGCALFKKKETASASKPGPAPVKTQEVKPVQSKPASTPPPPTPEEVYRMNYEKLPTSHTVVKGECLWWIAEYKQVYNDPFMWPLIYKANRDKIKNPDLIYPGQVFKIPREFTLEELKMSRKSAGAPRPYLPPKDANIPADLRVELNWGF